MNLFADYTITLNALLLVAEDLPVTMVHQGRRHQIICRLFADRVELSVAGGKAEPGLQDLVSPGSEFGMAGRSFHLQLLRPQGPIVGLKGRLAMRIDSYGEHALPPASSSKTGYTQPLTSVAPRASPLSLDPIEIGAAALTPARHRRWLRHGSGDERRPIRRAGADP